MPTTTINMDPCTIETPRPRTHNTPSTIYRIDSIPLLEV